MRHDNQRMNTPPAPALRLNNIHRRYNVGTEAKPEVLHGISIALQSAEFGRKHAAQHHRAAEVAHLN